MRLQHWFLVIAVGSLVYVMLRGGDERYGPPAAARLNYDVMAVSDGMTGEAAALDLQDNLDVSLLPDIGKQAIREAAGQNLKEQAFLQAMLLGVSNRVREISTIDLNADGTVDPVLVRPEPASDENYVLLSLQVPTPEAYPLPSATDQKAWSSVETLEVATMTVSLNKEQLTVEASGNQHVYPNSGQQTYSAYDRQPSFMQTYFAIRMAEWMFFPRSYGFYGAGYGYGGYQPMGVGSVYGTRNAAVSSHNYSRAQAGTSSSVRTRAGTAPSSAYSRAYASTPPKSLSNLKASRRFTARPAGTSTGSGGFGRGTAPSASRSAARTPTRRYATQRAAPRGFGGFGRGASRSVFGGGGSRFGK